MVNSMARLARKYSAAIWPIVIALAFASALPDPFNCCATNLTFAAQKSIINIGDASDDDFDIAKHLRLLAPDYNYSAQRPPVIASSALTNCAPPPTTSNLAIYQMNAAYLI